MPENDNLEARIADSRLAEELRQNPILKRAFATAKERCEREWRGSAVEDSARRESAYHKLLALEALETEIEGVINDGKMAKAISARRK